MKTQRSIEATTQLEVSGFDLHSAVVRSIEKVVAPDDEGRNLSSIYQIVRVSVAHGSDYMRSVAAVLKAEAASDP